MLVAGLADCGHGAAVVMDGGGPVAAVEEDKLRRGVAAAELPARALDRCLRQVEARPTDLSVVALAGRPARARLRETRFRRGLARTADDQLTRRAGAVEQRASHIYTLRRAVREGVPVVAFEHHLCHAASAFHPSPYDRALVLTLDESGDMWSGLVAVGEGTSLQMQRRMCFPDSLGWLYSEVTELLGYRRGADEQKIQWLSRCDSPEPDFTPVFRTLFGRNVDGLPTLERGFLDHDGIGRPKLSASVATQLGLRTGVAPERALQATIARSLQEFLEETVIGIAERYRVESGARHLCVSGGVFLNVLLIRALERRTGFDSVFVQPVAGNHGTALGAAYLARKRLTGNPRREPLAHLQLGPEAEPREIKAVLDNCKVVYTHFGREDQLLARTAGLLGRQQIVAWYQGRMEFGFRALGNRSILASPFSAYVKENLNHFIKHREDFHPFVLSVPAERATELFEYGPNCRFAASVGELRPGCVELEHLTFGSGQVRLHLVEAAANPRLHALLHRFGETAPAPVLVNTSFNLFGEPLVCEPRDAMRSFYCAGVDAMVMGDFLVVK